MSLNSEIKTIIQSLVPNTLYLRAATLNEANVELPKIELVDPIGIHAALPSINNTQRLANVLQMTSVEVLFLKKNTSQDDTGEEIDVILADTKILADQFIHQLNQLDLKSPTDDLEVNDYEATTVTTFSDEVLSGWHLIIDFPEVVKPYDCA